MAEERKIRINATAERSVPNYVNQIRIQHNGEEFLLELYSVHPPQGVLVNRIVISPAHAKRLLTALGENIEKYEQNFGEIKELPIPFKLNGTEESV